MDVIRSPPDRITIESDQAACKRDKAMQRTFIQLAADGKDPISDIQGQFAASRILPFVHVRPPSFQTRIPVFYKRRRSRKA